MSDENRGRPPKYLTVERFEKFLSNDFWHLKIMVKASFWITLTILAAIIAQWAIR
jgi:hypothetical protein